MIVGRGNDKLTRTAGGVTGTMAQQWAGETTDLGCAQEVTEARWQEKLALHSAVPSSGSEVPDLCSSADDESVKHSTHLAPAMDECFLESEDIELQFSGLLEGKV